MTQWLENIGSDKITSLILLDYPAESTEDRFFQHVASNLTLLYQGGKRPFLRV
jgi:hypothetical protein